MSKPNAALVRHYLKNLLKALEEKEEKVNTHCKRTDGSDRAWFHTKEEEDAFAIDPANVAYHGDVTTFCAQSEAVAWLEATMRPLDGDELIIENARRPKDLNCDPYPRQMTHADRVFLNDCGIFLHMLSWRDGYYWKARERRESAAPEREFAEQLKRDWEEYEQRRKR